MSVSRRKFTKECKQAAVRRLDSRRKKADESQIAELERKIGQQTLEIDFLERVLQRVEEARSLRTNRTGNRKGNADEHRFQMCAAAKVSRAGFYRRRGTSEAEDRDMELRDEIQKIALEMPCYGRRRITAELRRRGWTVNPKRVQRIMREDNLLGLAAEQVRAYNRFRSQASDLPQLGWDREVTGIDQLWVAGITYIRLEKEFIYLAVVLDAYSRRVIG